MRINVTAIKRYYEEQVEQTTIELHGSNVGGLVIYHPITEQWVSTTNAGLILAFGDDGNGVALKETFDTNNECHRRAVQWVNKLVEKPQPPLPSKVIRRGLPMTAKNRLKICEMLQTYHRDKTPCLVTKTDDGHYQIVLVNEDLITVNQQGDVCKWYGHEFKKTVIIDEPSSGDQYTIATDLRITDLRDRVTKERRKKR